jgi:homoserine dehydrogenase
MSASRPFVFALIGFGNIGTGVVRHVRDYQEVLESRLGRPIRLKTICDVDITRDRGVSTRGIELTSDYQDITADPEIEAVVELVGGTGVSRRIVEACLKAGKHVVTANKALIAEYGAELFDLADKHKVSILFEAAVGAGIPIIKSFQGALLPNRINKIHGILNGTTNYILSRMEDDASADYAAVVADAQRLGYAEPDPTLDVEGVDAAHKIAILGALAFGIDARAADVVREGVTRITAADFAFARERDQTIKLLATAGLDESGALALSVWPTLVPTDHLMGRTRGVVNAVMVDAEPIGPTFAMGAGAGQGSTSSGVMSDLMQIALAADCATLQRMNPLRMPRPVGQEECRLAEVSHPARLLRVLTRDSAGVAKSLGRQVVAETDGAVFLSLPVQTADQREETLGKLVSLGIKKDAACEIRVALQENAERPLKF